MVSTNHNCYIQPPVRHGQYEMEPRDDAERKLTALGRRQAAATGERLAAMARDDDTNFTAMHCSSMTRAIETADIIGRCLPGVPRTAPQDNLREGRPCNTIPGRSTPSRDRAAFVDGARIEAAFRALFHRSTEWEVVEPPPLPAAVEAAPAVVPSVGGVAADNAAVVDSGVGVGSGSGNGNGSGSGGSGGSGTPDTASVTRKHEFEVVVAHGNVIRFFIMRALQLPPEAWLRLSSKEKEDPFKIIPAICLLHLVPHMPEGMSVKVFGPLTRSLTGSTHSLTPPPLHSFVRLRSPQTAFNCSITYIVIKPDGRVSLRSLGDTGHLSMEETTFSQHLGYNW